MSAIIEKQKNLASSRSLLENQKKEKENAFNYYLSIIINAIDNCGGLIHEGNYNLFTRQDNVSGERIVYYCHSWEPYNEKEPKLYNKAIKLYSEDGYENLEDIAHWADIATAFSNKLME